jgi:hypothetical protein
MEPREDEKKAEEPQTGAKEAKPRRFRIVKLEERIAPSRQGEGTAFTKCHCTLGAACSVHKTGGC